MRTNITTLPTTTNANNLEFVLDDSHIMSLKVNELKQQLSLGGLSENGLKMYLQDHLKKAMVNKVPLQDATTASAAPNGFKSTVKLVFHSLIFQNDPVQFQN